MPPLAPIYRHLGVRLRAVREGRGWTQARLAEAIGRGSEYLSKIERGRVRIQLEDLGKIAAALEVAVADLVAGVALQSRATAVRERGHRPRPRAVNEAVERLAQLASALEPADVEALITMVHRLTARTLAS